MIRMVSFVAALALAASITPVAASEKSDCMRGVSMIKAQLKKKHPAPVLEQLRKALESANMEVAEGDWPECLDAVKAARNAIRK